MRHRFGQAAGAKSDVVDGPAAARDVIAAGRGDAVVTVLNAASSTTVPVVVPDMTAASLLPNILIVTIAWSVSPSASSTS
jgi:hypothetical protein|tara:strand:+ start:499 stop:738 length:240 start_codon:yes stop_codon:yes gene_type:complete